MTYPSQNLGYSIANGASPIGAPLFFSRDPTSYDISFPIQQKWVNVQTQGIWILETLAPTAGVIYAQWRSVAPVKLATSDPTASDYLYPLGQIWGNTTSSRFFILVSVTGTTAIWDVIAGPSVGDISSLTGNTGGVVTGDVSGNVNILGAAGQIAVTGNPGTNTLTISLTGAGTAIDSFQPDTGTNPVVPTSGGLVTMSGSGSIQSVGGTNQLTYQLTGLTNHAVLVGAGTSTITKITVGNTGELLTGTTGADPSFSNSSDGDFTFTQPLNPSALSRKLLISNADTANSTSDASIILSVGGTSSGDPYLLTSIDTTRAYSFGPDVSNSSILKINTAATSSVTPSTGTNLWQMTSAGARTMAQQPLFEAISVSTQTNATGGPAGPAPQVIFGSVLQQRGGSNYNSATGTFTAPITGTYIFTCGVELGNIDVTHTQGELALSGISPATNLSLVGGNIAAMRGGPSNTVQLSCSRTVQLTAGDTVGVVVLVFGTSQTISINAATYTYFTGALLY